MDYTVSRADLAGSERSSSASPEPDVLERLKDLAQFEFVSSRPDAAAHVDPDDDDEGLEFQLFAVPKHDDSQQTVSAKQSHKIRLRSPSPDPEKVGFVRPHRDPRYYFADALGAEERSELERSALTGDQVLKIARSPWPGSAYEWKVLRLPATGLCKDLRKEKRALFPRLTAAEPPEKRTRPGKKYRIKLRKKAAASLAKKEAKKAADEAKEAAEKEKRTRRNREKKVKKKAKEKAKKEEGKVDGEEREVAEETGAEE